MSTGKGVVGSTSSGIRQAQIPWPAEGPWTFTAPSSLSVLLCPVPELVPALRHLEDDASLGRWVLREAEEAPGRRKRRGLAAEPQGQSGEEAPRGAEHRGA